jgi:hypothetical protein
VKRPPEPTRRQRWLPYVRWIADLTALKDWQIDIEEAPPRDETIASCWPCEGRKIGTFRLSESFLDSTPSKQRHAIVHELIHLHHGAYVHAVESKTDHCKVLALLDEYTVDGLADGFAHLLPLPPKE